ncbi:hypothetical protein NIES2135_26270 [Leptolyngbya boryana NIES-2135]|jgi:hypothetical protein|uniref:Uncharacterized protein n=1 Tax=Leptolyngbya boryana NIES-2135 TaxID=1973484 RepID=A0A1Z4JGK2_LEPBY|nr:MULTISPECIES: hypothetical protein [Leptolyngbya]BAY55803.1 hypothetical protein NIES2135_26270 [Leptolyngbya boryana NIES-2135]MBD2368892.1 hypothetical protein [Leptolyngbya sp. FACHB-161]MBD2375240.1 hypothetical protein [Leptolyngbya sp. FACHB-238]MBD2399658.1 hypothetical protein [Leptolyngbya sp. FACHB-239]MBD2405864.1 hypothetical protein [Leptolyngbya sp. FACHB-402]
MSTEEQLLEYWRKLPSDAQHQVLEFTRSLQTEDNSPDLGAPEHLTIRSREHLDQLLQEGLESGDSIEVTDDWWAQKRDLLFRNTSATC